MSSFAWKAHNLLLQYNLTGNDGEVVELYAMHTKPFRERSHRLQASQGFLDVSTRSLHELQTEILKQEE